MNKNSNISIMIHGPIGSGKSTIAAKILSVLKQEGFDVKYSGKDIIRERESNCVNIIDRTNVTIYEIQEPR